MMTLRRVTVCTPNGKLLVLVLDGQFIKGMKENNFVLERIPAKAIVAIEEALPESQPTAALGWSPKDDAELLARSRTESQA